MKQATDILGYIMVQVGIEYLTLTRHSKSQRERGEQHIIYLTSLGGKTNLKSVNKSARCT